VTDDTDEPGDTEEDSDGTEDGLSRPFLETDETAEPLPVPAEHDDEDDDRVRPYLITTGRTSTEDVTVQMQTVVVVTAPAVEVCPGPKGTAEHARIVELCTKPHSVAELAAGLRVPFGVARVLVADLLSSGLLATGPAVPQQATDVPFLERLIAGVAAL
jgi:Protein of unknown function (DUF742)